VLVRGVYSSDVEREVTRWQRRNGQLAVQRGVCNADLKTALNNPFGLQSLERLVEGGHRLVHVSVVVHS
jgi:hypothetical protein